MRGGFLVVFLLSVHLHSFGQVLIPVEEETDLLKVTTTYLFSDSSRTLTASDVLEIPIDQWEKKVLATYSQNAEWILVPFTNPSDKEIQKILYLSNPITHECEIFFATDGKLTDRRIASGLVNSNKHKLYNDPGYPYRITFPPKTNLFVLIKVHDPLSSIQVPIYLLSSETAYNYKDTNLILIFFWIGVLTFSILLSFLLFFNTKQKTFLYYTIFAIATGIVITSTTGVVTMFIDSDPYQIITNYYQWGAILLINFMPRFINSLVPIFSISRTGWKILKVLGYVGVVIAILYSIPFFKFSFFFTRLFINTVVLLTAITFLYVLITLAIAIVRGYRKSLALFIVYLIYLTLGFINIILPLFGVTNFQLNSIHIVLAGSVLEIMAFMIFMGQAALQVYQERQKLLEQVKDNQELMMRTIVNSQENERNRFARDLHDGIGQMISILNMNLKSLKENAKPNERQRVFEASSGIIDDMYGELKNICFDLMPQTLIKNGLESALKEFTDRVNDSGRLFVELNVFGLTGRLHELQEISLYRISQEWVNNILKYSDAEKIMLQITQDEEEITLMIEDDGSGFDKDLLINSKGNGWKNLNTRTNLIKGQLELETQPDKKGSVLIMNAPSTLEGAPDQVKIPPSYEQGH